MRCRMLSFVNYTLGNFQDYKMQRRRKDNDATNSCDDYYITFSYRDAGTMSSDCYGNIRY